MRERSAGGRKRIYRPEELVDAPEYHAYSRAFGILEAGLWEHRVRSVGERIREFVHAFPPNEPGRNTEGSFSLRDLGALRASGSKAWLGRFAAEDGQWRSGSVCELLARYGLKMKGTSTAPGDAFEPVDLRTASRRRNQKLRVLHGTADLEAGDMDAAKIEFMERQERVRAAREARAAVTQMQRELDAGNEE